MSIGERGGVVETSGALDTPAGLKEKSGSAETDFCLKPGAEPRRALGYAWSDIGRALGAEADAGESESGARWGNVKSGFGMSSMGPAVEALRRW